MKYTVKTGDIEEEYEGHVDDIIKLLKETREETVYLSTIDMDEE